MCIDIIEIWFGIANWQISPNSRGVLSISFYVFLCDSRVNQFVAFLYNLCLDHAKNSESSVLALLES